MSQSHRVFEIGTPVTYKCGSPTFIVVEDDGPEFRNVLLGWFNNSTNTPESFKVLKLVIETIEEFHLRKLRLEAQHNKRVYEVPGNMELENILTIGFLSPEHKEIFMEKMFAEEAPGEIFSKDPKPSFN